MYDMLYPVAYGFMKRKRCCREPKTKEFDGIAFMGVRTCIIIGFTIVGFIAGVVRIVTGDPMRNWAEESLVLIKSIKPPRKEIFRMSCLPFRSVTKAGL